MSSLALLILCFVFGVLGRRVLALPPETPKVLNTWVLYVSLPALVLHVVHKATFEPAVLIAASTLWLNFVLVAVAAWFIAKRGWVTRELAGGVALCAGLGNTAFVGLPLLEAIGGPSTTPIAALIDQLGTFLAFSVLAVPFATVMGGQHANVTQVLRRVVTFPPFIALVAAVALRSVEFHPVVDTVLSRFADMLTPLALCSIGFQLDLSALQGNLKPISVGLTFKLFVAPLLTWLILRSARPAFTATEHIAVGQAAMAPMVTAAVLAAEHNLAPKVCAAIIAAGVLLSFITVWLWWSVTA